MAGFYMDPTGRPDPDREVRKGIAGRFELREQRRAAVLGVRGIACPACDMPLSVAAPLVWDQLATCPFCDGVAPTREFIRDHGWPEVELVARFH
jgi:hypothetical protein